MIPTTSHGGAEKEFGSLRLAGEENVGPTVVETKKADGGDDGGVELKRGPWSEEEDMILLGYLKKHGEGNWNSVQKNSGLARCGKSCRLRWANHLRPNLKKGNFSPEEERFIAELHAKYGNKWARMAALMPERSDNEIKNYWNTRVKRHHRRGLPLYPPGIQPSHSQNPLPHRRRRRGDYYDSAPTTPTSSFSFQLPSPTSSTPFDINETPKCISTPPLSPLSALSSPTTTPSTSSTAHFDFSRQINSLPSFAFQANLASPTYPTHISTPTSPALPPLSPLSSPSTNNASSPALALLDFSFPRSPPILQAPMRFKRFSSETTGTNDNSGTNDISPPSSSLINHKTDFSFPISPINSPSTSSITSLGGCSDRLCVTNLLRTSSSEFHEELQKENEKMYALLASVTQTELPSTQLMSPPPMSHTGSHGFGIGSNFSPKIDKRVNMKKHGGASKDKGIAAFGAMSSANGVRQDIFPEDKTLVFSKQSSTEQNPTISQDQKPELLLNFEPEPTPKVEPVDPLNSLPEDLSDLLIDFPSSMETDFFFESTEHISDGPASVLTDDNLCFEMQQIASVLPTTTNVGRSLSSCSWDNLPGLC